MNAFDGAVVTRVMLERCCLRWWAAARMSIDYVKCFDIIPEAVIRLQCEPLRSS